MTAMRIVRSYTTSAEESGLSLFGLTGMFLNYGLKGVSFVEQDLFSSILEKVNAVGLYCLIDKRFNDCER